MLYLYGISTTEKSFQLLYCVCNTNNGNILKIINFFYNEVSFSISNFFLLLNDCQPSILDFILERHSRHIVSRQSIKIVVQGV